MHLCNSLWLSLRFQQLQKALFVFPSFLSLTSACHTEYQYLKKKLQPKDSSPLDTITNVEKHLSSDSKDTYTRFEVKNPLLIFSPPFLYI